MLLMNLGFVLNIKLFSDHKPEEYEMMYQHIDVIEKLVRNQG